MTSKRWLIVVAAVAVVVLAIVLAVTFMGGDESATAGAEGAPVQGTAPTTTDASPAAVTEQVDPARQEPVLDKFTSKDPFAALKGSGTSPTPTPTASPTSTPQQPTSASVSIDGVTVTVKTGDHVPKTDPVFDISAIQTSGVTFTLLDNMHFDDGSTSVSVAQGQTVTATNDDTGDTYTLRVISLGYANSGGNNGSGNGNGNGNGGSTVQGRSITLLSINTQNGTSTATFKVSGQTYADKAQGDTFNTGWGQIKVLNVNAGAQAATILHGDATLVLHVGQTITK